MDTQHHSLLSASLGTQREIVSFHFGGEHTRQVYIQAVLHGDEIPGMAVAWFLKQKLRVLEADGKLNAAITLVPVANPLALGQHWHGTQLGRFETASGQDFNRDFPAPGAAIANQLADKLTDSEAHNRQLIRGALDSYFDQQQPLNELQSQRFTLMRMACQANLMIDLHCDWEAIPHLYTTPDAWPAIEPLARYLGSDVQLLAEISGGEPFDEACCEPWVHLAREFGDRYPMPQGLLPVTLELRGVRDVSPQQAAADADAIIHALRYSGYIQGTCSTLPELKNSATPLAGCEYISAPHSGLVLHHRELGEWIEAGEIVAEIVDPTTDKVTPLIAEFGGRLYARHWTKFVTAGMLVVRLAGEDAGRSGNLLVG